MTNPPTYNFSFYYYARDHLGSVRQVVRADRTTNGTVCLPRISAISGLG